MKQQDKVLWVVLGYIVLCWGAFRISPQLGLYLVLAGIGYLFYDAFIALRKWWKRREERLRHPWERGDYL